MNRLLLWLPATLLILQGCTTGVLLGTVAAVGSGTTAVLNDRRHADVQYMDGEVCKKIRASLEQDSEISSRARIEASCYNKVVLLTGEAPSEALRARAVDMARLTHVRKIHNEIWVIPSLSENAREADTWMKTTIGALLVGQKFFDASLVEVTVSNRVVYLMGLLTENEARQIETLVSKVEGVVRVISLIEYVTLQPVAG